VSVIGKELSEYAPHSSTSNHMQPAPTRTANLKGKAGSEDCWSKGREEKHPGPQEGEAARPAVSACRRNRISNKGASDLEEADRGAVSPRKLRSQHKLEPPVATRYVLDSDSE